MRVRGGRPRHTVCRRGVRTRPKRRKYAGEGRKMETYFNIYERKLRLWWRRKTDTKEAVEIDRV